MDDKPDLLALQYLLLMKLAWYSVAKVNNLRLIICVDASLSDRFDGMLLWYS